MTWRVRSSFACQVAVDPGHPARRVRIGVASIAVVSRDVVAFVLNHQTYSQLTHIDAPG
ncbi:MAG TPA: hypothetical protein VGH53_19015 [Streptosporangiaceae bacterium]|jgi:hypothetical protein